MNSRDRAAESKRRSQGSGRAAKGIAATRKVAPVKKPAMAAASARKVSTPIKKIEAKKTVAPPKAVAKPMPVPPVKTAAPPVAAVAVKSAVAPSRPPAAAKPPGQDAASRLATAQQAEERRKAATRKLFARLRSLEAIVGADLRKRGSLLLSQAVDQWYAEAISATASDVTITNAARAVIAQL
jgi:hypothetical protein